MHSLLKEEVNFSINKRVNSKRGIKEAQPDSVNGLQSVKHLINNMSPNYIELNRMIMDKINNPKKTLTEYEKMNETNKFNKTTRFKYAYKTKPALVSTPKHSNAIPSDFNAIQPEVKGYQIANPSETPLMTKENLVIQSRKANFLASGKIPKNSKIYSNLIKSHRCIKIKDRKALLNNYAPYGLFLNKFNQIYLT